MPTERPLSEEEEAELDQLCAEAFGLLPHPGDLGMAEDTPGVLPRFIGVMAEAVRRGFELPIEIGQEALALRLGALFGDEVARISGWEWVYLDFENGLEGLAVVSEDRALALMPLHMVATIVRDPGVANTLESVWQTVAGGELGAVRPGAYAVLG